MQARVKDILNIPDVQARWHGDESKLEHTFSGISTDSRTVRPGELFFALRGEQFDGHHYVRNALEKKAVAAVVNREWHQQNQDVGKCIVVPDTLTAYQELARLHRKKMNVPVVALTGSSGKTTTKEFVYSVLSQKYNVLKSQKSYNNHIGVPATLLELSPDHDLVVAELGTSQFGELERLSYLAEPNVCLLLNIGYAHLEFFKNRQGVAKAKLEILSHAKKDGTVIYNADDDILCDQKYPLKKNVSFAIETSADIQPDTLFCDDEGRYQFSLQDRDIKLKVPGRHNVLNALAAAAAGVEFDVSISEIKTGLENVNHIELRMDVIYEHDLVIINDAYNANPGSCYSAMATAADFTKKGRRIGVLGDMLELGDTAAKEHENLATFAKQFDFDMLFLFGDLTAHTRTNAIKQGIKAFHSTDRDELVRELEGYVQPGDLVLVKGSRSMHMEYVVEALTKKTKKE